MESGDTLGHYRILSLLAKGGMGEVYMATDMRLERKVALKILPAAVAQNSERMQRFAREARVSSALNHPNIAHIYDLGETNGIHFLVMEFIDGEPLDRRIAGRPLAPNEIAAVGAQIADALEAAHSKGIIHRDVKAANIMVTARGHVKVLDFGLAKILAEAQPGESEAGSLSTPGAVIGTLGYMSPEQATGGEVDHRADIFSAGVVLYQMATGRTPFQGSTTGETIARIVHAQPEPMARFNRELPPELDRIVSRCLEKDPALRYDSAGDLLADLRKLLRPSEPARTLGHAAGTARSGSRIRAVLVDDEDLARQILREYLRSEPDVEIVAECANGFEAVKAASEYKPDLLFLDVQMPKLDGFEVLELIDRDIAVVFVTAFDQYAMKAFDAAAVDYLLKPFSMERFQAAVQRVRRRLGERQTMPDAGELRNAVRPPGQYLERIVVKDGVRVHIIPVHKLDYVEAQDDYVALHSERKSYLKQQTISSLETALDPARFVRVHRSFLVNLERVVKIEPYTKEKRVAVLAGGDQIPVSRGGYARLKELLED